MLILPFCFADEEVEVTHSCICPLLSSVRTPGWVLGAEETGRTRPGISSQGVRSLTGVFLSGNQEVWEWRKASDSGSAFSVLLVIWVQILAVALRSSISLSLCHPLGSPVKSESSGVQELAPLSSSQFCIYWYYVVISQGGSIYTTETGKKGFFTLGEPLIKHLSTHRYPNLATFLYFHF